MVALTRKTGLPIGVCRAAVELTALFFGWRLGGMVGIGTVLSALLIGFCVQLVFKLLKFVPPVSGTRPSGKPIALSYHSAINLLRGKHFSYNTRGFRRWQNCQRVLLSYP
jgi:uncharacterized membrane protein YraQ (UPF0718 family)